MRYLLVLAILCGCFSFEPPDPFEPNDLPETAFVLDQSLSSHTIDSDLNFDDDTEDYYLLPPEFAPFAYGVRGDVLVEFSIIDSGILVRVCAKNIIPISYTLTLETM